MEFKNIYDEDSFNSHGFVGHCTDIFESRQSYHDIEGAQPASKQQRELLFSKMKEVGYVFDFEKKKLKKINQKSYGQRKECSDCQFNYAGECKGSCAMKRSEQKTFLQKCFKTEYERGKNDAVVWSEEDEDEFQIIQKIICDSDTSSTLANRLSNWLQSLKERAVWKPSEEQLYWLKYAADSTSDTEKGNEAEAVLNELYEQLKKLKE